MTLRQKTTLIISVAIIVLSVILVISANTVVFRGFSTVETHETEINLNRAVKAVNMEMDYLAVFVEDWATSDDAYQFVAGSNAQYIKKNINPSTFISQQLNVMAFFDTQRKQVYGTLFDPDTKMFIPLPESVRSQLQADPALFAHSSPDSTIRGLVLSSEGPLFIASRLIVDSEKKLTPSGVMIVGRFLNSAVLAKIADRNHLSLQIQSYQNKNLPADFSRATQNLSNKSMIWIAPIDEKTIAGYATLTDLKGQPGLILRVDAPRVSYLQGQQTIQYFTFLLIAITLLFGLADLFFLEKTILARLSSLSRQVFNIGENSAPSLRVKIAGQDELSVLADSINIMLGSLDTTQNELKESEAATRALLEGMPDFLMRVDRRGTILDFKTDRDRAVATPAKLLAGNSIGDAYPPPLVNKMAAALELAFETCSTQLFEHEMVVNNHVVHHEIRVTPINGAEAIVILRDFTERKQMEKSLQFFNLRDSLTAVFNRTYWEEKLATISQLDDTTVGIILCEIDEMRLIEDSLGTEHANNLLISTAAALRASLPLDVVIARTSAEKFSVLIIGAADTKLKKLERKIRQELDRSGENEVHLRFGISLGYASGIPWKIGLPEILNSAQARLHREKLSHSQASRSRLFQSLQTALETRDFVSHQHAARLWALGKSLAKEAGMPARRLRNFKLLTQFHDIGKVGVPDELIFKHGKLFPNEIKQMKQHVEIGHRIAQSIPELYPIADLLLKHHEWWNGKGYPLELTGEEIPLECRIFSIVDAYDAITNDRPDRKALSTKEAAVELRRGSGSQFDPDLVKKFLVILGEEP